MSSRRDAPPSSTSDNSPYGLPSQYKFLKVLGEGGFGSVLKCLKKDTQETVAIKIPIYTEVKKEATLLKRFMRHNFDQRHIVKFLDSFDTEFGKALVFEELDISLDTYLKSTWFRPMQLRDIRNIIRQTATALDALKSLGVIHADMKLDNIMLVDRQRRPLEVKLIDFGLAVPTCKVKQGMKLQTEEFRAPEILLGLPFDEGIDMWSLGCMMAIMITGGLLFSANTEYELLHCIVHLLGQPADHLLNDGMYTKRYFTRTETDGWRFETPQDYWLLGPEDMCLGLSSLDNLKKVRLERLNKTENLEREHCIELLKAMLTIDPTQRITPREVLDHPFISWTEVDNSSSIVNNIKDSDSWTFATSEDMSSLESLAEEYSHRNELWTSSSEDSDCEPPATAPEDKDTTTTRPDDRSPSPTTTPSRVIYVRPATPENTWDNVGSTDSFLPNVINISRNELWTSSNEDSDHEPSATAPEDKDATTTRPDDRSPAPTTTPSCVICVRPAAPENTWDNVGSTDRNELGTSSNEDSHHEPPATAPEDKDATTTRPDDRSPAPTTTPSRVICVRPAAPENTWDNVGSTDSLQPGQTETAEPLVTDADNDTSTPEDSTAPPRLSSPASQLFLKKKKNCFRRFYSWMKKKFFCCLTCVDDNEEESWTEVDNSSSIVNNIKDSDSWTFATTEDMSSLESLAEEYSHSFHVINTSRNELWTSSNEDSHHEPPATAPEDKDATTTRPDDRSPAPTTTPSRVICVRPAAPENTWDNVGSTDSLQAGQTETAEPLVTDADNDTSTPEDSTAPPRLSSPASQLFLKKKKNCFRRFYSWMKKKFFCCLTCVDDNEEE